MMSEEIITLLSDSTHLIVISCFGGLVLFGLKIAEHFNRPFESKLDFWRYLFFFVALFLCLPVLGGAVTSIYLVNGDQMSPVLAFQVGLTSPAIVQSMIIAAANKMASEKVQVEDDNQ